jgi:hypothetical protein
MVGDGHDTSPTPGAAGYEALTCQAGPPTARGGGGLGVVVAGGGGSGVVVGAEVVGAASPSATDAGWEETGEDEADQTAEITVRTSRTPIVIHGPDRLIATRCRLRPTPSPRRDDAD